MIGHQHVRVADLLIDADCLDEIDVAFVREDFDEIVAVASDIGSAR